MKKFIEIIIIPIVLLGFTLGFGKNANATVEPFVNPPINLSWLVLDSLDYNTNSLPIIRIKRWDDLKKKMQSDNKRYIIKYRYNLRGDTIRLGRNCCIDFEGGQISNGVIIGDKTIIKYSNKPVFKSIQIQGSWRVPTIKTGMFADAYNENVLIQLFNLTNDSLVNRVIIEHGNYLVSAKIDNDGILRPKSNTEVIFNGNIVLSPNKYQHYQIMSIYGAENLYIHGEGRIEGDLYNHYYDEEKGTHEWGHGLTIRGCKNVLVEGITLKNCIGDACSVGAQAPGDLEKGAPTGKPSINIEFKKCKFESSRRQGLTITFASFITVDSCSFNGIYQTYKGTAPGAAIDIEPDDNGSKFFERGSEVYHILIKNSTFTNCRQGVASWKSSSKDDSRCYKDVQIENCVFSNIDFFCCNITGFDNVLIRNNIVTQSKNKYIFTRCINVDN